MIPPELFKRRRRHNNTPEPVLLIIANFISVTVGISLFTNNKHRLHWFFWVCMGLLALYNFFNIRRNVHLYNRATIVSYLISIVVLVLMFFLLKGKA
jgi:4-amino-4-deoxy-L-arabinose transferase-like glycosyltransferase